MGSAGKRNRKMRVKRVESRRPKVDAVVRGPSPGFTLIELIAAMTILLLLTTAAMPLARLQVQRERELELRRDLRDLRQAIDRYKALADPLGNGTCAGGKIQCKIDTFGYPPDMDTLVNGVLLGGGGANVNLGLPQNSLTTGAATTKYKFLRRIPVDPMTGTKDWGLRSMQDDADSMSWGGQNVFDVFTKSTGKALDGTNYSDW